MSARVVYQDAIPYDTPSSLRALTGPGEGVLVLQITVHWGPDPTADLSTPDGVEKAYESLVREGTAQQQEALLNVERLRRVWPELRLPRRCRDLWASRFSDLARSQQCCRGRNTRAPRRRLSATRSAVTAWPSPDP